MGAPYKGKAEKNPIRTMYPRHYNLARYVACGATAQQLCEMTGMVPSQMTKIMHSPVFKAEVDRLNGIIEEDAVRNIKEDLARLGPRAVEVIDEQLNYPGVDEKVRQRAAFDILDRLGYGNKKPGGQPGVNINLTKIGQIVNEASKEEIKDDVMELIEGDFTEE